ncbi:prepilin-type N-terminal cleavage/methylation domain-containing protein [Ferrimonas marina]|uniref:Prepilin-type N-terminal cleavage/methylation domain-containing protein n=1 Tax=Ferrimonas marina TaxID=299255 RepID=A0A1M5X3Y3_9GAMM|nr:prepilin-type N-terminal cleavage/methylation domain-containing protein [Ferrimonas marina]SHH94501.1 prepilin-type N-terminal cleavage/methylation domain-containing protein [Ferrimonas marina]
MKGRQQGGFTLIELVAVVVVLAVLALVVYSRQISLRQDAQVAVLNELRGQLQQVMVQVDTLKQVPSRVRTDSNGNQYLSYDNNKEYRLEKGYLSRVEICHILGLTDTAMSSNGKQDSTDGRFSCKDENRDFAWIRMTGLDSSVCYLRYKTFNNYTQRPQPVLEGECSS